MRGEGEWEEKPGERPLHSSVPVSLEGVKEREGERERREGYQVWPHSRPRLLLPCLLHILNDLKYASLPVT